MLADSPDAILVASDIYDIDHASAVEIKTMTSVRTIEAATTVSHWRMLGWTKIVPKYFENSFLRQSIVPRYYITQLHCALIKLFLSLRLAGQ